MSSTNKTKRRKRLHVYPRNLLAGSGIIQVCLLQVHIEAIIRMENVLVGAYLLAFILTSTLNILNGFGFSTRPKISTVMGTIFVTLFQMLFGILYISAMAGESQFFTSDSTIPAMVFSCIFFLAGMIFALVAIFFEIKVYRHADDIYQYMM